MNVDVGQKSAVLEQLFDNPDIEILLDANILIPPDRRQCGVRPIAFSFYKEKWLDPLFMEFSNLAIHVSVYDELVADNVKAYAEGKNSESPQRLRIYADVSDANEQALFQSYIRKIAVHSKYIPERDNSSDRGEVRSLSFMAVKGMVYFASNDALPIRLVEKAEELHTGLENMTVLKVYEMIYYLYKTGKYDNSALRALYKYLYRLVTNEKNTNPDWGVFIEKMDKVYNMRES